MINISLCFVRHGDHDKQENLSEYFFPLTERWKQEVDYVKSIHNINELQSIWFAAENKRSIDTVCRIIWSEWVKRFKVLNNLLYINMSPWIFLEWLNESIKNKKVMRRTIYNSDELMRLIGYKQSSYTVMAQDVCNIILKYCKLFPHWEKISIRYEDKNLYRVFCGKEFIYASFRAKVIETICWIEEKERYVSWYEKNLDNRPEARLEKIVIRIHKEWELIKILLIDWYGEMNIPIEVIEEIVK